MPGIRSLNKENTSSPNETYGPAAKPNAPDKSNAADSASIPAPTASPSVKRSYANSKLIRPPTIGSALPPIL